MRLGLLLPEKLFQVRHVLPHEIYRCSAFAAICTSALNACDFGDESFPCPLRMSAFCASLCTELLVEPCCTSHVLHVLSLLSCLVFFSAQGYFHGLRLWHRMREKTSTSQRGSGLNISTLGRTSASEATPRGPPQFTCAGGFFGRTAASPRDPKRRRSCIVVSCVALSPGTPDEERKEALTDEEMTSGWYGQARERGTSPHWPGDDR